MNIDFSRLDRNFIEQPYLKCKEHGCISSIEKPSKNDLEYLYIELNMRKMEISKLLNLSRNTLTRCFKAYNIKKDRKESHKLTEETSEIKYGNKCSLLNDDIKKKIDNTNLSKYGNIIPMRNDNVKDKLKKTNISKYGTSSYTQTDEYKQKVKETCRKKYGVENVSQCSDIAEKRNQTNNKKYGGNAPTSSNEIIKKRQYNNLLKYGCEETSQIHYDKNIYKILSNKDKLKEYIKNSNRKTYYYLAKDLGVTDTALKRFIVKYNLQNLINKSWSASDDEREIQSLVSQYYDVEFNTRKYLGKKEIDIFIPKLNIGIEFNGNYWHSENKKEPTYHQKKSIIAEEKGIFIYHIFEYDWDSNKSKVIGNLKNLLGIDVQEVDSNECEIKEISDCEKSEFLKNNYIKEEVESVVNLGLYYKNELIYIMCCDYDNKWILRCLCSKIGYKIHNVNGLWNYFISYYNPKEVICYSDFAHIKDDEYKLLGFEYKSLTEPDYIWQRNNVACIKKYQCDEKEIQCMHNKGYHRIYDCGYKLWEYKKEG